MAHTVTITSVVKLTSEEMQKLQRALNVTNEDSIQYRVDPAAIAGLEVTIDGKTVDLTVRRQLADLEK